MYIDEYWDVVVGVNPQGSSFEVYTYSSLCQSLEATDL